MNENNRVLQVSCSEAVYRIDLTNLTEAEIIAIETVLHELEEYHQYGQYYAQIETLKETKPMTPEIQKQIDELEAKDEDNKWYDTGFGRDSIFGKQIIKIDGEVPYNCSAWLEGKLSKLPFWHKVSTEMDYP